MAKNPVVLRTTGFFCPYSVGELPRLDNNVFNDFRLGVQSTNRVFARALLSACREGARKVSSKTQATAFFITSAPVTADDAGIFPPNPTQPHNTFY